jgi:hypothetical protein
MTLVFTAQTPAWYSFTSFFVVGIGMGFVSLATLLVVQSAVPPCDLGVATASNQFARTLGGTVGVGIGGSFIAARFSMLKEMVQGGRLLTELPPRLQALGLDRAEELLQPEVLSVLPEALQAGIKETVRQGVSEVFWTVTGAAVLCLMLCWMIPRRNSCKTQQ